MISPTLGWQPSSIAFQHMKCTSNCLKSLKNVVILCLVDCCTYLLPLIKLMYIKVTAIKSLIRLAYKYRMQHLKYLHNLLRGITIIVSSNNYRIYSSRICIMCLVLGDIYIIHLLHLSVVHYSAIIIFIPNLYML